ncbi:hypothetical protein [Sphingomonas japonica]|uniref:Spore coat protein U (SCPU) domain-containing protein n=1 Tax=Sphingomonas japonica TaxID=511662 RepID=A0ABX0TY49_9SPHN|nr:hypothetical protein [Sphingomonas japonica]NIJ23158.1 hypothetical protein [Sphingomonas japonica]
MNGFRWLAVIVAMALCAVASNAFAQVTAYAPGQGPVNSIAVGIDVRASVRSRCGFAAGGAPVGTLQQADFDRTGFSKDFAVVLNCTGASRIAVSSVNGALATDTNSPGLASRAPYTVELRMVADNGTTATASCAATGLAAGGGCSFGGTASTTNGLQLGAASTKANGSYLRVSAPAYAGATPLAAGQYADTLTITVSVVP